MWTVLFLQLQNEAMKLVSSRVRILKFNTRPNEITKSFKRFFYPDFLVQVFLSVTMPHGCKCPIVCILTSDCNTSHGVSTLVSHICWFYLGLYIVILTTQHFRKIIPTHKSFILIYHPNTVLMYLIKQYISISKLIC